MLSQVLSSSESRDLRQQDGEAKWASQFTTLEQSEVPSRAVPASWPSPQTADPPKALQCRLNYGPAAHDSRWPGEPSILASGWRVTPPAQAMPFVAHMYR